MKDKFSKLTLLYAQYNFQKNEIIKSLEGKIIGIAGRSIDIRPSQNHWQLLVVGLYKVPLSSVIAHIEAMGEITIQELINISVHE